MKKMLSLLLILVLLFTVSPVMAGNNVKIRSGDNGNSQQVRDTVNSFLSKWLNFLNGKLEKIGDLAKDGFVFFKQGNTVKVMLKDNKVYDVICYGSPKTGTYMAWESVQYNETPPDVVSDVIEDVNAEIKEPPKPKELMIFANWNLKYKYYKAPPTKIRYSATTRTAISIPKLYGLGTDVSGMSGFVYNPEGRYGDELVDSDLSKLPSEYQTFYKTFLYDKNGNVYLNPIWLLTLNDLDFAGTTEANGKLKMGGVFLSEKELDTLLKAGVISEKTYDAIKEKADWSTDPLNSHVPSNPPVMILNVDENGNVSAKIVMRQDGSQSEQSFPVNTRAIEKVPADAFVVNLQNSIYSMRAGQEGYSYNGYNNSFDFFVTFKDKNGNITSGSLFDVITKAENAEQVLSDMGLKVKTYGSGDNVYHVVEGENTYYTFWSENGESDPDNAIYDGISYYIDKRTGEKIPVGITLDPKKYEELGIVHKYVYHVKDKNGNTVEQVRYSVDYKKAEKHFSEQLSKINEQLNALYKECSKAGGWDKLPPEKREEAIKLEKERDKTNRMLNAIRQIQRSHSSSGGGGSSITYVPFVPSMVVPDISGELTIRINLKQSDITENQSGKVESSSSSISNKIADFFRIKNVYALDYGPQFIDFYPNHSYVYPGEKITLFLKYKSTDMERFAPLGFWFWDGKSYTINHNLWRPSKEPDFDRINPVFVSDERDTDGNLIKKYEYVFPTTITKEYTDHGKKIECHPQIKIKFRNGANVFWKIIEFNVIDKSEVNEISYMRVRVFNEDGKVYYDKEISASQLKNSNTQEVKVGFSNLEKIREFILSPSPIHIKVEVFNANGDLILENEIENFKDWLDFNWDPLVVQVKHKDWYASWSWIKSLFDSRYGGYKGTIRLTDDFWDKMTSFFNEFPVYIYDKDNKTIKRLHITEGDLYVKKKIKNLYEKDEKGYFDKLYEDYVPFYLIGDPEHYIAVWDENGNGVILPYRTYWSKWRVYTNNAHTNETVFYGGMVLVPRQDGDYANTSPDIMRFGTSYIGTKEATNNIDTYSDDKGIITVTDDTIKIDRCKVFRYSGLPTQDWYGKETIRAYVSVYLGKTDGSGYRLNNILCPCSHYYACDDLAPYYEYQFSKISDYDKNRMEKIGIKKFTDADYIHITFGGTTHLKFNGSKFEVVIPLKSDPQPDLSKIGKAKGIYYVKGSFGIDTSAYFSRFHSGYSSYYNYNGHGLIRLKINIPISVPLNLTQGVKLYRLYDTNRPVVYDTFSFKPKTKKVDVYIFTPNLSRKIIGYHPDFNDGSYRIFSDQSASVLKDGSSLMVTLDTEPMKYFDTREIFKTISRYLSWTRFYYILLPNGNGFDYGFGNFVFSPEDSLYLVDKYNTYHSDEIGSLYTRLYVRSSSGKNITINIGDKLKRAVLNNNQISCLELKLADIIPILESKGFKFPEDYPLTAQILWNGILVNTSTHDTTNFHGHTPEFWITDDPTFSAPTYVEYYTDEELTELKVPPRPNLTWVGPGQNHNNKVFVTLRTRPTNKNVENVVVEKIENDNETATIDLKIEFKGEMFAQYYDNYQAKAYLKTLTGDSESLSVEKTSGYQRHKNYLKYRITIDISDMEDGLYTLNFYYHWRTPIDVFTGTLMIRRSNDITGGVDDNGNQGNDNNPSPGHPSPEIHFP